MLDKPTIAITGANGFIGSYLVKFFQKNGYKVIALARHFQNNDNEGVIYHYFDLDVPVNAAVLEGCDFLIHCAYVKKNYERDLDDINLNGTQSLYNISKKAGVKKFIFLSSLSAHGKAMSHYGQVKLKIELILDPTRDLILKPGLVLGNGGLFGSIFRVICSSWVLPLIDGGRQKIQGIDIEDLAACLKTGIEHNLTGIYPLVADEEFTLYDIAQTIAERVERKIWFIFVPYGLVSFIFSFFDILHIPFPLNKENLLGLKQNIVWESGDCLRIFGVQPQTYRQTIERMLS